MYKNAIFIESIMAAATNIAKINCGDPTIAITVSPADVATEPLVFTNPEGLFEDPIFWVGGDAYYRSLHDLLYEEEDHNPCITNTEITITI